MTSTFANDLRLNEMATGDQSGSWGTVTNKNLELIGDALGFGTEATFNQDQDKTTTVLDGDPDPARAMYFKVTSTVSGGLTATRKLTIAPDTINRLMFIENATTGGESITIKQGSGSGAAVTIPNGYTKAVILSGSGSGSIVLDAFASLSVDDLLVDDDLTVTGLATVTGGALLNGTTPTLTIGDAGAEDAKIVFDGNAADYHVGLDDSEDALQIGLGAALGTTPRITIRGTEVAVNDLGIDLNFRVESSNTAHLLFADGGEDVVGIGTPTPVPSAAAYKRAALHIHQEQGGSTGSQIHMTNDATGAAAGNGMFIAMWQDDDVYFTNQESDGNIKFATGGNNNVLVLDAAGAATFSSTVTADAYALDSIALPNAGTAKIFNRNTDASLYIQTSSGNAVYLLDGSQNTMYGVSPTSHSFAISNVGVNTITATESVFNDTGLNRDFRVESAVDTHTLFAKGSTGHVGVGTSTPDANGFGAGHGILGVASATGSAKTAMLNLIGDGNDTAGTRVASVFFNDASATGAGATLAGVEALRATNHATSPGADLHLRVHGGAGVGDYDTKLRISNTGDIDVETGDLFFSAAGRGIVLGATSNVADNTLTDYEEGVHVTSFVCTGSGEININSSFDTLFYTKIGRLVTINGRLKVNNVVSPVGAITFSLPFPALNIADTSCSVCLAPNTLASGSVTDFWGEVEQNGSRVVIYYGGGTAVASTAANKFAANTDLRVSVTYTAAA